MNELVQHILHIGDKEKVDIKGKIERKNIMNVELMSKEGQQHVKFTFEKKTKAKPMVFTQEEGKQIEKIIMDKLNGYHYIYFKYLTEVVVITPDGYYISINDRQKGLFLVKVSKNDLVISRTSFFTGLPHEFSVNVGEKRVYDRIYNPENEFEHFVIVE